MTGFRIQSVLCKIKKIASEQSKLELVGLKKGACQVRVQKTPNFFRSGAKPWSGPWKISGAVLARKIGAVRSGWAAIYDNFYLFYLFFAKICSKGFSTLKYCSCTSRKVFWQFCNKYPLWVQNIRRAEYEKIGGPKRSWSGPLRSKPASPLHGFRTLRQVAKKQPRSRTGVIISSKSVRTD